MTRPFNPVKLLLPSEEVARRLADAIRAGFFRIGSRLPSERSMAEQMQVSRPTVREAIRLLVEAGILTVRPGASGGTFVASEVVPLDFMAAAPAMGPTSFDEAIEVRRLILPWVARTATQYAEEADFERMREAIRFGREALPPADVEKSSPQEIGAVIIATMRFDLALAQATRNGLVLHLMELLLQWVEPMRHQTLHGRADLAYSLDLVETMMDAVASGDPQRTAAITEQRLGILEQALEAQTGRKLRRNRRPIS